jgi:membrane-associated phospholipid phosphatase
MSLSFVVLSIGLAAGVLASAVSISRHTDIDPIDPEREERWLVRRLARRPRLAAFVGRRLDPAAAGGLVLSLALVTIFVTAVGVAAVLDMVHQSRGLAELDDGVARWGHDHADERAVSALRVVTQLGGSVLVGCVMAVVAVYAYRRHRQLQVVLFLATVGFGVALLNNALKLAVDRERPAVDQLVGFSGSAFPSGHSAAAAAGWAAVALVLGGGRSRRTRALLAGGAAAIAFAVAASRALLGVHWLTDVVAGLLVGWGWFVLVAVAFGGRHQRLGEPAERVAAEPASAVSRS